MRKAPWCALGLCLAGLLNMTAPAWGQDPDMIVSETAGPEQAVPDSGEDPNVIPPEIPPAPQTTPVAPTWLGGPWLHLPDLPESKEQMGLEECGGKIYVVAGIHDGEETDSAFVYDPNTGRWSPIAPLPREVQSLCLRSVKGQLFSFGGYHHRWAIKYCNVWLYDPNADAWLPRAPLPVPREDAGSAVINGQVWIVGGLTNPEHRFVPQIDVYDPDLDAWILSFTIKPHDDGWPGRALGDFACAANGAIWCLAGTETTENYPLLRPDSLGFFATQSSLAYLPIPDPRCYAELEVIDNSLFVVGGCRTSTTDYADTMLILDLPTQTWKKPVPLPYGARGQGVCSCNGLLYVAGGYDGQTRKDFFLWMGEDDGPAR